MHNESTLSTFSVAIVGGKGYSGLELARLLKKHPAIKAITVFGSQDSQETLKARAKEFDTVFLATPAEVSIELAPLFLAEGTKVIDLSGAFRLETEAQYLEWYKLNHTQATLLKEAHFGLVPWNKPAVGEKLIANPGCYATSVLMGILPLLKTGVIEPASLVIDAKSGTTGAGKKAEEGLLFSEVDGECLPYKVGLHQHLPEIIQYAKTFAQQSISPFFTTSLLAARRGIIAGIYAKLAPGKTQNDVATAFQEFYGHYPLVKVEAGAQKELMQLKKVVGLAHTHITFKAEGEKLYLFSSIDNLLKGAASQAIENFNLSHHLPVESGLLHLEVIL